MHDGPCMSWTISIGFFLEIILRMLVYFLTFGELRSFFRDPFRSIDFGLVVVDVGVYVTEFIAGKVNGAEFAMKMVSKQ